MKINNLIILIVGILLLGGLFFISKPKQQNINTQVPPKTFDLVVKNKKLVSGPETIKVNQDEQIAIKITSNENDELHLHGYNISVEFEKDTQAELSFTASISGRFVYELEKSKIDLGAVEVQPK